MFGVLVIKPGFVVLVIKPGFVVLVINPDLWCLTVVYRALVSDSGVPGQWCMTVVSAVFTVPVCTLTDVLLSTRLALFC